MTQASSVPEIPGLDYVRPLGSGGYADVFLYEQRLPSRKVAVKVLKGGGLSAAVAERFTAEANAMALLEHPHIVPVYAAGSTPDGRPYLVMTYYPQASLGERAKRERFAVAEVLRIGIQIASAVETAHRAGLLHRDIKPANILTSQYGTPGLTDFGIASHMTESDDEDTGVSVPWSPVETLYMTGPATVRSDVYSLAATLWHLLVGRSPFEVPGGDNSTFALMRRVRDVPPPSTGRSDVPASLDRLLRTSLAKEAGVRPASALALARGLQAVEQELRLTRTDIILAAEDRTARAADALPGEDGTRLKPQQVTPTPAAAQARPAAAALAADDDGTRARPGGQSAPAGDSLTNLHAAQPISGGAPAPGRRGARGGVIAVAGVAIVAAAVVAFWLAGGSKLAPAPASTASPTPPPPALRTVPAPGVAEVAASRAGTAVTFTWTYANALPDDTFLVSVDGAEPVGTDKATLTREGSGPLCAKVRVVRADGSNYQREYSPQGCA